MIPGHLIDKAVQAVAERGGLVESAEIEAAIEAVAADIWDEGWKAGLDYEAAWTYYHAGERPRPKLPAHPYKRNETA